MYALKVTSPTGEIKKLYISEENRGGFINYLSQRLQSFVSTPVEHYIQLVQTYHPDWKIQEKIDFNFDIIENFTGLKEGTKVLIKNNNIITIDSNLAHSTEGLYFYRGIDNKNKSTMLYIADIKQKL